MWCFTPVIPALKLRREWRLHNLKKKKAFSPPSVHLGLLYLISQPTQTEVESLLTPGGPKDRDLPTKKMPTHWPVIPTLYAWGQELAEDIINFLTPSNLWVWLGSSHLSLRNTEIWLNKSYLYRLVDKAGYSRQISNHCWLKPPEQREWPSFVPHPSLN